MSPGRPLDERAGAVDQGRGAVEQGPRSPHESPLAPFLEAQGTLVLDGGLATALEARGCDLDDDLWSARVLLEEPETVREVHRDFLAAGADCIATVTYQATFPGLRARGLSDREAEESLRRAVRLAVEARDAFWSDPANRVGRLRPLVAASIGPYGAFLADGSEYRGDYGIGDEELYAFHERRWRILAASEADLIACETVPSLPEARALLRLLSETSDRWAWISFSCRNEAELSDGHALAEAARACDEAPGLAAVGINCTAPDLILSLIGEARRGTDKPILVYPNSGEGWDAARKLWTGRAATVEWGDAARAWSRAGASGVGGCCRVGPSEIREIRRGILS